MLSHKGNIFKMVTGGESLNRGVAIEMICFISQPIRLRSETNGISHGLKSVRTG